jgi:hypothetical protein
MRSFWLLSALSCSLALFAGPQFATRAPASGALEFTAHVTPADGRREPARQMPFYLLSKSLADIRSEVESNDPPPDMDHFIDTLELSKELKTWLKKHRTIDLTGKDFTKHLTADEVMTVPEFLEAYKNINGASLNASVPSPTSKERDRQKNPDKFQHAEEQYQQAMRHYITANPDTLDGLDAELGDKNPGRAWAKLRVEQQRRADRRTLEIAQTRYLVATTESDLEGHGAFTGVAPGTYWITTLDIPALAGDVRLRWDRLITIRAGETARLELSNVNAIESAEREAH